VYPNVFVLLTIIMTVPVTVASTERSFSRLKLIKTCLGTTMGQEGLTELAILSIQKTYLQLWTINKSGVHSVPEKAEKYNIYGE
jgi:hypothetical protein